MTYRRFRTIAVFVFLFIFGSSATGDEYRGILDNLPFPPYEMDTNRLERPCAPGVNDRGSDLCAQWKAADAATDSAIWTLGALVVGVLTLGAAIAAAIFASQAAAAAVRSTRDNRELGEAQVRAYLGKESLVIDPGDAAKHYAVMLGFLIRNSGNSPASIVLVGIGVALTAPKDDAKVEVNITAGREERSIAASGSIIRTRRMHVTDEEIEKCWRGEARLFFVCSVRFRHIFSIDNSFETFDLCVEILPQKPEGGLDAFRSRPHVYIDTQDWPNFELTFAQT